MNEAVSHPLQAWESFYVIVGGAGGALIGIQFVVITLIASIRRRTNLEVLDAFATPTVVHFTAALVISAFMSAPWPSLAVPSAGLILCGVWGLIYGGLIIRRARRQTDYKPVFEDWLWYLIAPWSLYAAIMVGAIFLLFESDNARFVIAAAVLSLLLVGVHNAWDSVTHIVRMAAEDDTDK